MRQFKHFKIRKRHTNTMLLYENFYVDGLKNNGCFFFVIKIRFLLKGKPKEKKKSQNFFVDNLIPNLKELYFVDFSSIIFKQIRQRKIKNIYEFQLFIGTRSIVNNPLDIKYRLGVICRTFLEKYNLFLQIYGIFLKTTHMIQIKQANNTDIIKIFKDFKKSLKLYWTIYSSLNKNLHHFFVNSLRKSSKIKIQVINIYNQVDFVINYKNLPGFCFLKKNNLDESNTENLHEHFRKLFVYVLYNIDYNAPFEQQLEFIKNLDTVEQNMLLNQLKDLKFLEEYCTRFFKYGN